ncbi:MFS-type transporter slc18b1 [Plakobranchus ocellatus]|uniref:MFS-type transporter slc18b1 n=1 Tax=Plakobranchus ocellatus TaxID=259542 RepID=A0AAV4AMI4_9GAST|nr:MFS-type transporter slc18b1 [Plakobranchus ocellatus]
MFIRQRPRKLQARAFMTFEDHTLNVRAGYEELKDETRDLSGQTNISKTTVAASCSDNPELTQLVPDANGQSTSTAAHGKTFKFKEIPTKSKVMLAMLLFAHFMAGCGFSVPGPFYPREARMKGMATSFIGLAFSSYLIVSFLGSLVFGQFMSYIGPRTVCTGGLFINGLFIAMFGFLDKMPAGSVFISLSFVIRILSAVGMSAFTSSNFAIVSSQFEDYVAQVFALLETSMGIGLMIGPTIGGGLFQMECYEYCGSTLDAQDTPVAPSSFAPGHSPGLAKSQKA